MEHHDRLDDPYVFHLKLRNRNSTETRFSEPLDEQLEDETNIAEAFANDGFFVLRDSFDIELLAPFREFSNRYFDQCFRDLCDHGHIPVPCYREEQNTTDETNPPYTYTLPQGAKHGFREIVMRSPGRYELSLLNLNRKCRDDLAGSSNNNAHDLFHHYRLDEKLPQLIGPLTSLLPRLVGPSCTRYEDLKLCHLSLLVATPGSSDQSWHADGGHTDVTKHLPCHCFNIFLPLQDTPHVLGPTEIRPSSHFLTRNLGPMMLAARCRKILRAPVWLELFVGDALVLDYRVLHRGRANRSVEGDNTGCEKVTGTESAKYTGMNRNYLVLSYSEPWFEDVLNFPKRSLYEPSSKSKNTSDGIERHE